MYNEQELREQVRRAIDDAEPCDLRDRLRRELRRNSDTGSTGRARRRAFNAMVKAWADQHLFDIFDEKAPGTAGSVAWQFFKSSPLSSGFAAFGQRAFYAALREAGWPVKQQGGVTMIIGTEYVE